VGEPGRKAPEDQVTEIRKLVSDAQDILVQVQLALGSLQERLEKEGDSARPS
jgi:hypothetical protein